MTFLQPLILLGLPLIGLPILIHLINRQRHRTVPWGAMMFLLDAKRLQKNMARLRYWLIMAMRMLAIAGILFAASRPFASGFVGSAVGTRADTVLLLLDRSPSMEQQDPVTQVSKRQTALTKLAAFLQSTAGNRRTILIESTSYQPEEIDVSRLMELPNTSATSSSADMPRMLQAAVDYIVDNEVGQTDIWIASDLREHDWRPEDGRWAVLRQAFAEREGVQFHLLTYAQPSRKNLSISVANVKKRTLSNSNELVLDVRIRRSPGDAPPQTLPLEFVVNGARSVMDVSLEKEEFVLQGHVIPIDRSVSSGWGRVEIPGDENLADNTAFFVFADEPLRLTTVIADDERSAAPLRIAAAMAPDPAIPFAAVVLSSSRVAEVDWERSSLVMWQSALPTGLVADQMQAFLDSGRPVMFFPPEAPSDNAFLQLRWGDWQAAPTNDPVGIASMLSDSDLLARTQSGSALPLTKQKTLRYCQLLGTGKVLARLTTGDPLLLRAGSDIPAYFFSTLPRPDYSSLARDGVTLYVMMQRAIALGAEHQGDARHVEAGSQAAVEVSDWSLVTSLPNGVVSSSRPYYAAAYHQEDAVFASVNRSAGEDDPRIVADATLETMLAGLDYHKISDDLGEGNPLANEIWRVFLALMAIALVVEASLCLS